MDYYNISLILVVTDILIMILLLASLSYVDQANANQEQLREGTELETTNEKFHEEVKSKLDSIEKTINQITLELSTKKVNFETFILQRSVNSLVNKIKAVEQSLGPMLELTQRHERILSGAQSKGALGEQLVGERLADLPQAWYDVNVPLKNGAKAKFALRAPNGRWIPIDSTWTATVLLDRLGQATDPAERTALITYAKKLVINRARDARIYIDKDSTLGFCIVAVPDPVFEVCVDIQAKLTSADIVLISHSLLVPYLLLIVNFYLKNIQAAQILQMSGILSRSTSQIEEIKNYIYRQVEPPLDIVQQQQTTFGLQNDGLGKAYEKISEIQRDIDLLKSTINPGPNADIGSIPAKLQKYLTSVQESLLEGIAKQNGHSPNSTIK